MRQMLSIAPTRACTVGFDCFPLSQQSTLGNWVPPGFPGGTIFPDGEAQRGLPDGHDPD